MIWCELHNRPVRPARVRPSCLCAAETTKVPPDNAIPLAVCHANALMSSGRFAIRQWMCTAPPCLGQPRPIFHHPSALAVNLLPLSRQHSAESLRPRFTTDAEVITTLCVPVDGRQLWHGSSRDFDLGCRGSLRDLGPFKCSRTTGKSHSRKKSCC